MSPRQPKSACGRVHLLRRGDSGTPELRTNGAQGLNSNLSDLLPDSHQLNVGGPRWGAEWVTIPPMAFSNLLNKLKISARKESGGGTGIRIHDRPAGFPAERPAAGAKHPAGGSEAKCRAVINRADGLREPAHDRTLHPKGLRRCHRSGSVLAGSPRR